MVLQWKTVALQYVTESPFPKSISFKYTANTFLFVCAENRFQPIYDFGYVAMNFNWVYPEDSGEYVCRATNLYGQDETRAVIKSTGKPGIIYDSQLPKHMKSIDKIREMEASWQV